MATSNTRIFIETRDDIITNALRRVRAIKPAELPKPEQLIDLSNQLNSMIKSWHSESIFLWTQSSATLALTIGTASYNLPVDVIDVEGNGFITIDGYDNIVQRITREEYQNIPTKAITGKPIQFYIDFQLANPVLYVYYVPDKSYTLTYNKIVKLQDFTNKSNNPDFPVMWYDAIMLNLAYRIAPMYAFPINEMEHLRFDANDTKTKCLLTMKGIGEGASSMRFSMDRR